MAHLLPRGAQPGRDLVAPAEGEGAVARSEGPGEGDAPSVGGHPLPADLDGGHGLGQALEVEVAAGGDRVAPTPPAERHHDLGGEDLVALRGRAQAGGLDDRGAEHVVVLDGDVAGAQPDADRQAHVGAPHRPVERLLDGDRCVGGPGRGPEGGEEAVAEALDHPAAVAGDRLGDQGVVGPAHGVGAVLAQPGP